MITSDKFYDIKLQINNIIDSLVELIKNPNNIIKTKTYNTHDPERKFFQIYLYLFKLIITKTDYLTNKYNIYISKFANKSQIDIKKITNLNVKTELELLLKIKNKLLNESFIYNQIEERLYFNDNTYIESNYLLMTIILILDNPKEYNINNEINICYAIPNKDTKKIETDKKDFLSNFTFYSLTIKHVDKSKEIKDKSIIILKNAAINYLKHLKQFQHGLETSDSYQIFYNLLKNESTKQGFLLIEEEKNLLEVDNNLLQKINNIIDDEFTTYSLRKQISIIENIIWQSSNDITLIEYMHQNIDNLINLLTIIKDNADSTYEQIAEKHKINSIENLLVLISCKFLLTYGLNFEDIDYSLLDLSSVKPKYMSQICATEEKELKNKIRKISVEIELTKKNLEAFKTARNNLNKLELGKEKYHKELERCVSNINSSSIKIARLNSTYSALIKEYEELQKKLDKNHRKSNLYSNNLSIIKHICNAITGCSFYLKTNNSSSLFNNIIVFEDYEKTDNSFYLEISFKELLKISKIQNIKAVIEQNDLPKLLD